MLELIQHIFDKTDRLWKLSDGAYIEPEISDIETVLDDVAAKLYAEPVGSRLTVGGMSIEKTETGFDVYVYVGTYK